MQRRIVRQYLILSFLFTAAGMQLISAVYVTFLLKNGLSLLQVNLVNTVFFVTLFVCEIPTGAFADIFGRKMSFVIACGLLSASMFVYGSSHTFFGFACAEILGAVGATFKSGAFQAWLVDNLKHHGYEGSYTKIFGRESLLNQIGGGIGAITGAYLAAHNPALPWFTGGSVIAIVAILAWVIMKEEYFVRGTLSWKRGLVSMRDITRTSIAYGINHKAVRFILVVTFVQFCAMQALNMYWQPFFRGHGLPEAPLGFLFSAMTVSLAIGAFVASRIHTEGKERSMILRSQLFVGVVVIVGAVSYGLPALVILFLLHEVGRGFLAPVKDNYLHQRIPSHERATIGSFCSISHHIGGAIGLVISGVIAEYFGISAAWVISGVALIIGALLVARNGSSHE